ncbi:MAG: FmdB family zinc ribbon protein [Micropruina sp.]
MPTYQYRCVDCSTDLEAVQRFTDDSLTDCPACDGSLRKVYSAVGVVFKGSGFYATDNRTKGKAAAASPTDKPATTSVSSGSSSSASASSSSTGGSSAA